MAVLSELLGIVYVLFDPQCPHCAALWESAQPLHRQTRFVWLPVALLNAKSLPQGAAIMTAANPAETMNTHERELLANGGGIAALLFDPASNSHPSVTIDVTENYAALLMGDTSGNWGDPSPFRPPR